MNTLFPLGKIGKEATVGNLRPLAFRNAIRKVMSSILLRRIQEKSEQYLSAKNGAKALIKMKNIFKQEKISEKLRIKLYKACLVPH